MILTMQDKHAILHTRCKSLEASIKRLKGVSNQCWVFGSGRASINRETLDLALSNVQRDMLLCDQAAALRDEK